MDQLVLQPVGPPVLLQGRRGVYSRQFQPVRPEADVRPLQVDME